MSPIVLAAFLVGVVALSPACQPKPKPKPNQIDQECCIRSYQAELHETSVQAGTVTLFVTVNQYRWFGQPNDPQGGVFRAETRDAPAEAAAFDVGFSPAKAGTGLRPESTRAATDEKGLLVVKVPTGVLEYARHGSGTVVNIQPSMNGTDPWVQTKRQVAFPEGPATVEFQTLSDMLLNSGR